MTGVDYTQLEAVCTNTFCILDKYILQYGQIHFYWQVVGADYTQLEAALNRDQVITDNYDAVSRCNHPLINPSSL